MEGFKNTRVFRVIFLAIFVVFSQVGVYNECYSDYGCVSSNAEKFQGKYLRACRYPRVTPETADEISHCAILIFHCNNMACITKTTVFCVIFLAFYAVFSKVEAYDQCSFDYQCTSSILKYCCDRKYPEDNVCRSSCIGQSCIINSDCAPGECCNSDDKCTTGDCSSVTKCSSDYQCSGSYSYCCERKFPEDNVCRSSCIGQSCIDNSDCAPGECCNSDAKCSTGDCSIDVDLDGLAGWIVAVIVISVIVTIVVPIAIVVFCCCCAATASRPTARAGVVNVVAQPATTGATVVQAQQQQQPYPAQPGMPMNYQPYPNQPPPPYQPEGMAYPPGESVPPTH